MIVGRSAVLDRMDRLLRHLVEGGGSRLLVTGDPGIGKTALLDVVQRRARALSVRTVRVCGADGEDDLPFALLDDLHRVLGVPAAVRRLGVAGRGELLLQALVAATCDEPLLLLVDDAQYADDASRAALALAADRAQDLPLLVIVAMRPDHAALARFARWSTVRLEPLDDESSRAILRSVLGSDCPASVLADLVRCLGGNPLALRESPQMLRADERQGASRLPDPLPVVPLLAAAWGAALDRLPSGTDDALLDLAVAGAHAEVYAGLRPEGRAVEDLEPADLAGLVTLAGSPGPAFAHPLVREVVLQRAGAALTSRRHAAAADVCDERDLPPAVRAHHLVRSTLVADERVAARLADVAEQAERLDQVQVAVAAWSASARLSPDRGARISRATRGLGALVTKGASNDELAALVAHLDDAELEPEPLAWLAIARSWLLAAREPGAAVAALWSAVDRARDAAPDLVGGLLWELAATAWSQGRTDDACRAAQEFASLSQDPRIPPATAPGWIRDALLSAAAFQSGDVAGSVPLRRAVAAANDALDPATADLLTLTDAVFVDDLMLDLRPAAGHRLQSLARRIVDEGEPRACIWGIQAWRARARGDLESATRLLTEGVRLVEALGDPQASAVVDVHTGMLALAVEIASVRGDDQQLQELAATLRQSCGLIDDRRRLATADRAAGLRALVAGRLDVAVVSLAAAADLPFLGRGLRDAILPARIDLVEVHVRLDDIASARRRAEAVRPLLDAMDEPLADALSERAAALVAADPDEAAEHYARAVQHHARGTDPFEHARTLLLQGEQRRRHHRRAEARTALLEAAAVFDRLGARPWSERVAAELRVAGGGVRAAHDTSSLTPQELAVAQEVASGRSNREIAEALFLSPRTVEYHLGNVYRKLGVHGRAGLTRTIVAAEPVDLRAGRGSPVRQP